MGEVPIIYVVSQFFIVRMLMVLYFNYYVVRRLCTVEIHDHVRV